MNKAMNKSTQYVPILCVLALTALPLTGCVDAGGKQLSLLPSSQVLDPLEVPPGLSPLPEAEQFLLPSDVASDQMDPENLPPEQFRNYESWVSFEQFKKFKENEELAKVNVEEYEAAKRSGQGNFRAISEKTTDGSVRLRVADTFDSLWPRLQPMLQDMGVIVADVSKSSGVLYVKNIATKEPPKLSERVGFKEYRGRIEELHVRQSEDGSVQYIVPMTSQGATVKHSAAKDFFERLRYYTLANYQLDETEQVQVAANRVSAWYDLDESGERTVMLADEFSSTWVQVGRTLEASGVNIDDLNRSEGLYIVSFRSNEPGKKKRWWAFWRKKNDRDITNRQFHVTVIESGENTRVSVIPVEDSEENATAAQNLLDVIYERMVT